MKEIFRVLKNGGEFYFSDVFVDRRLPEEIAFDPLLHSECLGGAMYHRDFTCLAKEVGFKDPRVLTSVNRLHIARRNLADISDFEILKMESRDVSKTSYNYILVWRNDFKNRGSGRKI